MRPLFVLALWCGLVLPAAAADLQPQGIAESVDVGGVDGSTPYFLLPAGSSFDYSTPGPMDLLVSVRRLLSEDEDVGAPVFLMVYGDGHELLRIRVSGPVDPDLMAAGWQPVGEPSLSRVTVPAGGTTLRLLSPAETPPLLVRVEAEGEEEAEPVQPRIAAAPPAPKAPAREPIARAPIPDLEEEEAPAPRARSHVEGMDRAPSRSRPELGAYATLGLGAPSRGDKAVGFLGIGGSLGAIPELLDLRLGVGFYSIGVNQQDAFVDPSIGLVSVDSQWRTSVVPLTLDAVFFPPLGLEAVRPMVGAGLGLYIASRKEGELKSGGATAGLRLSTGAEIALGPGALVPTLSLDLARRRFGNENATGEIARESLSTFRFDLSYLLRF